MHDLKSNPHDALLDDLLDASREPRRETSAVCVELPPFDSTLLARYRLHAATPAEEERVEGHLLACSGCRQALHELGAAASKADSLRFRRRASGVVVAVAAAASLVFMLSVDDERSAPILPHYQISYVQGTDAELRTARSEDRTEPDEPWRLHIGSELVLVLSAAGNGALVAKAELSVAAFADFDGNRLQRVGDDGWKKREELGLVAFELHTSAEDLLGTRVGHRSLVFCIARHDEDLTALLGVSRERITTVPGVDCISRRILYAAAP